MGYRVGRLFIKRSSTRNWLKKCNKSVEMLLKVRSCLEAGSEFLLGRPVSCVLSIDCLIDCAASTAFQLINQSISQLTA